MRTVWGLFLSVLFMFGSAYADVEEAKNKMSKLFPNFKPVEINETPIPGIYEMLSENGDIIYVYTNKDAGYLFFGELWTSHGKSLTQESKERFTSRVIEKIDTKDAVKIGDGKHKVMAFIDPQCVYCKRGIEYFLKRDDTTLYIFFVPLFGEQSKEKSIYVICSKNTVEALQEIIFSDSPAKNKKIEGECKRDAEERFQRIMVNSRPLGIRGVPLFVIDKKIIYGANFEEIEKTIGKSNIKREDKQ